MPPLHGTLANALPSPLPIMCALIGAGLPACKGVQVMQWQHLHGHPEPRSQLVSRPTKEHTAQNEAEGCCWACPCSGCSHGPKRPPSARQDLSGCTPLPCTHDCTAHMCTVAVLRMLSECTANGRLPRYSAHFLQGIAAAAAWLSPYTSRCVKTRGRQRATRSAARLGRVSDGLLQHAARAHVDGECGQAARSWVTRWAGPVG